MPSRARSMARWPSYADAVIAPLCRAIRDAEPETTAFVIACFSDPGLFSAREATAKPVLGIAECGILMGVGQRLAGDLPIGLGVTELADCRRTLSRMIEIGHRLREQYG